MLVFVVGVVGLVWSSLGLIEVDPNKSSSKPEQIGANP